MLRRRRYEDEREWLLVSDRREGRGAAVVSARGIEENRDKLQLMRPVCPVAH